METDAHTKMVRTKTGAANSDWLCFIRKCAVDYHAQKKAEVDAAEAAKRETPCVCPVKRGRGRPKIVRDDKGGKI